MAKTSGNTRGNSMPSGSAIERLQNSRNMFISEGMKRYESEKDNPGWDYSDMNALTETDKTYLVAYLSHAYGVMNEALRGEREMNDEITTMVKGVDRAINKLTPFEGTVYRGIQFDSGRLLTDRREYQAVLDYYKSNVGDIITERGYTSSGKIKTKIDRKFTSSNGNNIKFTIDSKTGRDLSRYNDEEHEVLFKRGTRFRVVSVRGNNIHLQEV